MKLISSKLVFSNKWIQLYSKRYKLDSGNEDDFYVIGRKTKIAAIFALVGDEVLLVKQYRWAVDTETLDIPGGGVEVNEEPLTAAKRELLEETGYEANKWDILLQRYLDSGQKDCIQYIYLAQELLKISQPDENEHTTVISQKISSIMKEIVENPHAPVESTLAIATATYVARQAPSSES